MIFSKMPQRSVARLRVHSTHALGDSTCMHNLDQPNMKQVARRVIEHSGRANPGVQHRIHLVADANRLLGDNLMRSDPLPRVIASLDLRNYGFFFFQAEDGIRDLTVTGVQTCALPISGFCGGLTTFSTFSAEVVTLMQQGRALWALGAVAAHLAGSFLMTFAGIGTVVLCKAHS